MIRSPRKLGPAGEASRSGPRGALATSAGLALLGLGLVTCGPAVPPASPDPWGGALQVARFEDLDPDPHVVEVNLEARMGEWEIAPGQSVHAMTYNGSVPGPLLEARVGDTVIVHFTNHLDEPTTIHWHGVRVPAAMDGAPMAQNPVPPGGTFEYRFVVPDAGTFWYHPHVHETMQMEYGLYGPIVVRGDDEPRVDAEGVVLLDDLTLGPDGQIAPEGDLLEAHEGREGPIQLVNGRTGVTVPIRAGERQRWRIINAGSARFYRLGLAGHRFTVLGTDGGFLAAPREVDEFLMTPGDRVDVVLTGTGTPGASVALQNLPYSRGHGAGLTTAQDVLQLAYTADAPVEPRQLPAAFAPIAPLATDGVTPKTITFDETVDPVTGATTFTINGQAYPNVPDVEARVGATEVWDLVNMSAMDHPFHLHGFFFQVLEQDGAPPAFASWEDTLDLRGHGRTRIAFQPDTRPGMWMYHCHILEHAATGMMADVHVAP
jgi:FtsP/CotA-like multicopper oxidase with cupredoxin domain